MRPRWFGVGLNPPPSFLLCTSYQAQSASPSTYQLFVLVFLSQSLPPCPAIISAAPTTSPASSPSLFPPACLSLDSSSCWCKCFNETVSSLALPGEVMEHPESWIPTSHAGVESGCQGGRSSWEQGPALGWVSVHVQLPRATRSCLCPRLA